MAVKHRLTVHSVESQPRFRRRGQQSDPPLLLPAQYEHSDKVNQYLSIVAKGLPRWSGGKESVCQAGDMGLIPVSAKSSGEGNDNLLQYSCLENPMDRGAWWATGHGVTRVRHDLATTQQ